MREINELRAEVGHLRGELNRLRNEVMSGEFRKQDALDESAYELLVTQLDANISRISSWTEGEWQGVAVVPKEAWDAYWRHLERSAVLVQGEGKENMRYRNLRVFTGTVLVPVVYRILK